MASRPGGVEILLAASCYRNQTVISSGSFEPVGSKASLMHVCTECMINKCCVQCLCCREDIDVTATSTNADITGISASFIETYKEVLFTRYGLFQSISVGTVFQYCQINYFSNTVQMLQIQIVLKHTKCLFFTMCTNILSFQ